MADFWQKRIHKKDINHSGYLGLSMVCGDLRYKAGAGIEPAYKGFAVPCLTTWLPRQR